jgi:transposase
MLHWKESGITETEDEVEEMEGEVKAHAEVIGDVGVLVGFLKQMKLPELLDGHIRRHPREQGLSWGWVISIWLVYIVSQGDHRKVTVEDWVRQKGSILELLTGLPIGPSDFTDDRLTIALRHLSENECWQEIEEDLGRSLIRIYDLACQTARVDATTISGYHEGGETSLWQYGHSKDDPALRQIKLMMAALDPLGLPIAMTIASGESADDPLYLPVIKQACQTIGKLALLFVGDCKLSAGANRAGIDLAGQYYLTPLSLVGETAERMPEWVQTALQQEATLCQVIIEEEDGTKRPIARGYEFKRTCTNGEHHWQERVLIVQSFAYAKSQERHLEEQLAKAEAELVALTPPVGRGKRQIRTKQDLESRAEAIVEKYEVKGLLLYSYECETKVIEQFVGRGRGGPNRERREVRHMRYQITGVKRVAASIKEHKAHLGWRAYATNAPQSRLTLCQAVLEYRHEYRVERVFERFKGDRLAIAPMFVTRDDQVVGLPRLLSLGVRLLTLMEYVARCHLQEQERPLAGLYPGRPSKTTTVPTAERLLQALVHITLIIITLQDRVVYQVQGLYDVQERVLDVLGFPPDLYTSLSRTVKQVSRASLAA